LGILNETFEKRSLLRQLGVSSDFNPRNTQCIHQGTYLVAPLVKIFVFLDLAQN